MADPGTGPAAATWTGDADGVHKRDQLAGIAVLAWGEAGRQVSAAPVAQRVDLGAQPAA
jgi:hypothetical protein